MSDQDRERIADFGEKIGGARKDLARPTGPRPERRKADDEQRPVWARQYRIDQIAEGPAAGRWRVSFRGRALHRDDMGVSSREECEAAIPQLEAERTHRILIIRSPSGELTHAITRKIGEHKHPTVKGGFASYEEAKAYLRTNSVEILEHKFVFPEAPWLEKIVRVGPECREGDVKPQQFQETFGFRGGEFGLWNMGSDGQAALNHAYDALMDLARVLRVEAKALSLGGDLAIAFGARGHGGKDAARAHYEEDYNVINLTKIHGAGGLAHEWFHALDAHLVRVEKQPEKRDGRFVRSGFASYGWPKGSNPKRVCPETVATFTALVQTQLSRERSETLNANAAETVADQCANGVKRSLDNIRSDFTYDYSRYPRRGCRQPTGDELQKFDALARQIVDGDFGSHVWVPARISSGRFLAERESYDRVEELNALYKDVRGSSFARMDPNSPGNRLVWAIKSMMAARARVQRAAGGEKETKRGPSQYFKDARAIDEFRASDYFSKTHEMGARAFAAYVQDNLRVAGERSDYLVYAVDNSYYAHLQMKPFPEGEERVAINAAFDRLFATRPLEMERENVRAELQGLDPGTMLREVAAQAAEKGEVRTAEVVRDAARCIGSERERGSGRTLGL